MALWTVFFRKNTKIEYFVSKEWNLVSRASLHDGFALFRCFGRAPGADLNLQFKY